MRNVRAMVANIKKLTHFGPWSDPGGEKLIKKRLDIEVRRLSTADPDAANWEAMRAAHGYMIGAGLATTRPVWLATEALMSRCPDLLAVCSAGAGYDTIDVAACTR